MTGVDPVFRVMATPVKSTNATPLSAIGNIPSLTIGDLNIIWLHVVPSASSTDPGVPTVDGVAIAAAGATNSAGWLTVATSYDAGSPGTRLTVLARIRQSGFPTTVTWAWASPGNYITGGESWQAGTFDPADPIPAASVAFQAQATSSATFAAPSITTTVLGVICSLFGNRTAGTWNTIPGTTRGVDYVTSSVNYAACDTNTAQPANSYVKSAIFSAASSVGNAGSWLIKSNPTTPPANTPPVANAGVDQASVEAGATVTLTGTDSDADGTIASRTWTQVGGLAVALNVAGASCTFAAPITLSGASLVFQYAVTDNGGATGTDTVTITIMPAARRVKIAGVMQPGIQRVKVP